MKNFFKKIGKGLKNLGKGIKNVFNSKIGRIIGTIALAAAMPYLFNAFASTGAGAAVGPGVSVTGSATAGTASTTLGASASLPAGTIAQPSATALSEGAKQLAVQAGDTATKFAKTISNTSELLQAGNEVSKNALSLIGDASSITDAVKLTSSPTNLTSTTLESMATSGDVLTKEELITQNFNAALENKNIPLDSFSAKEAELATTYGDNAYTAKDFYTLDQQGTLGRRLSADKVARGQYEYLFQSGTGDAASMQIVDGRMTGLAGETNVAADALGMDPSGLKASPQHSSVGAALSAGKGPVEKMANVAKHFLDMDIAQATGYEGPLSGASVVGTATTGASLLSQMQPEEELSFGSSNYGPQIQAQELQSSAREVTMAPPIQPITMNMQEELFASSNPAQLMSSIRAKAGQSQLYGGLFNFGTANVS